MLARFKTPALVGALLALAACGTPSPVALRVPAAAAAASNSAAARHIDAVIARIGGADLFENISSGDNALVRHRRSGLVCRFNPNDPTQTLSIYPQPMPRGDDVGCQLSSHPVEGSHTLFATRFPGVNTLEEALGISVALMRRQYPDLRPFEGTSADVAIQRDDLRPPPPSRTARFVTTLNGVPHYTRVSVAMVNGWTIKQRFTRPVGELPEQGAAAADLLAGLVWADTLLRFTNGSALDRPQPGRERAA